VTSPVGEPAAARALLREAASRLSEAGVASPEYDAAELLAHVLGTTRSRLPLVDRVEPHQVAAYEELITRRSTREPLQHLTGSAAFRHVELAVGPGVFVPRQETELLAGWAIDRARDRARETGAPAVVVDLCCGSGAIALSVADEAHLIALACQPPPEGHVHWSVRLLANQVVLLEGMPPISRELVRRTLKKTPSSHGGYSAG